MAAFLFGDMPPGTIGLQDRLVGRSMAPAFGERALMLILTLTSTLARRLCAGSPTT
jgi:hypothetical protein